MIINEWGDNEWGGLFYEQSAIEEYGGKTCARVRIKTDKDKLPSAMVDHTLRSMAEHIADDVAQVWADDQYGQERPIPLLEITVLFYFDRKAGEAGADEDDGADVEMVMEEHHKLDEWIINSMTVRKA
jgi:hypothetical protein